MCNEKQKTVGSFGCCGGNYISALKYPNWFNRQHQGPEFMKVCAQISLQCMVLLCFKEPIYAHNNGI